MLTGRFKASCVIPTIRPAYPWATTLRMDVRDAACGHISGARRFASSDFTDAARPRRSFSRHSACCSNCRRPQGAKMTAKIIRLAIAGRTPWPKRDSLFFDSAPFMSMWQFYRDAIYGRASRCKQQSDT
jgi:hypothetical protein